MGRTSMPYNDSLVEAESVGGTVPPATCPGALASKLSRRAGPPWRGICTVAVRRVWRVGIPLQNSLNQI